MEKHKRNEARAIGKPVMLQQEDRMEFAVVYISNGLLGAEIVKGRLESAGIPAMLKSEAQGVFPMTIDGMGQVEVLVAKEREQEARELLSQKGRAGERESG